MGGVNFVAETKLSSLGLNIYPNPSKGVFNIELKDIGKNASLEVFNTMGTRVISQPYKSEIDLSSQPKGVYFIKVTDKERMNTSKIIVE